EEQTTALRGRLFAVVHADADVLARTVVTERVGERRQRSVRAVHADGARRVDDVVVVVDVEALGREGDDPLGRTTDGVVAVQVVLVDHARRGVQGRDGVHLLEVTGVDVGRGDQVAELEDIGGRLSRRAHVVHVVQVRLDVARREVQAGVVEAFDGVSRVAGDGAAGGVDDHRVAEQLTLTRRSGLTARRPATTQPRSAGSGTVGRH